MLVSCVAYENGRKIADIPVADISEYVHRPRVLIWVALFEPTIDELDEMAQGIARDSGASCTDLRVAAHVSTPSGPAREAAERAFSRCR